MERLTHRFLRSLVKGSYDLELESLVTVQPHRQCADPKNDKDDGTEIDITEIDVSMSNCESDESHYSGLLVEYVELRPFEGYYERNRGKR